MFNADFNAAFDKHATANLALILDLRNELSQYSKSEFDAGLRALRVARTYRASGSENRSLPQAAIDAGINQGQNGSGVADILVHVSRS